MISFEERRKRRILVTGAGGLIGSEACLHLFGAGYHVLALYRNKPSVSKNTPWDKVFFDLETEEAPSLLNSLLPLHAIVHCAAVIPSGFYGENAEEAGARNRKIDDSVASILPKIPRVVYCSSTSVYKTPYPIKVDETSRVEGMGPYGQEKIGSEDLFLSQTEAYLLRICAPYGPLLKSRTVLRLFIENALKGRDLTYHGSGSRQQDFTHVKDIARAILCSLETETQGGYFNIASGSPITMKELAELIINIIPHTGSKVIPSGQIDPQEGWTAPFSIEKAARELGWSPRISLEEGIRDWVEYIRKSTT